MGGSSSRYNNHPWNKDVNTLIERFDTLIEKMDVVSKKWSRVRVLSNLMIIAGFTVIVVVPRVIMTCFVKTISIILLICLGVTIYKFANNEEMRSEIEVTDEIESEFRKLLVRAKRLLEVHEKNKIEYERVRDVISSLKDSVRIKAEPVGNDVDKLEWLKPTVVDVLQDLTVDKTESIFRDICILCHYCSIMIENIWGCRNTSKFVKHLIRLKKILKEEGPWRDEVQEHPRQEARQDKEPEGTREEKGQEGSWQERGQEGHQLEDGQNEGHEGPRQDKGQEGPCQEKGQEGHRQEKGHEGPRQDKGQEGSRQDKGQEKGHEGSCQEKEQEGHQLEDGQNEGHEGPRQDKGQEGSRQDKGQEKGHEGPRQDKGQEGSRQDKGQEKGHEGPCQEKGQEGHQLEDGQNEGHEGPRQDKGQEGSRQDKGQEKGHEGPRQDKGHEGHRREKGQEKGHEGPRQEKGQEGSRQDKGQEKGHEGPRQDKGHEGHRQEKGQEKGHEGPRQEKGQEDGQDKGQEDHRQNNFSGLGPAVQRIVNSINAKPVCDYQGKVSSTIAYWLCSAQDSHILRTSNLCHYLKQNHDHIVDGFELGDSTFPCRPFLLTPYFNPQTRSQRKLCRSHFRTTVTIESTFGRLKRLFHILHSEIRMQPPKNCKIIVACAVLHNIAILRNESLLVEYVRPHHQNLKK